MCSSMVCHLRSFLPSFLCVLLSVCVCVCVCVCCWSLPSLSERYGYLLSSCHVYRRLSLSLSLSFSPFLRASVEAARTPSSFSLIEIYRVSPKSSHIWLVLPSFTEFYRVLPSFTWFYLVLLFCFLGFTGFYWVL